MGARMLRFCAILFPPVFFIISAASARADSRYPVKIGPTGRYLVDRHDKPFLIAGESPQAMTVNLSEADAELFFKNRRSHGFNTTWIDLLCAKYTGGREDASTFDGIKPFKTAGDFSQPNEEFFARCDRIIRIAAKYDTLVMLDPAETGSFLEWMQKNGVDKCRNFGRYLGNRYKDFDNLLWVHGNDYGQDTPENDKLVIAIAEGIKDAGDRHLHTIEIDWKSNFMTSLDNERWAAIVGMSAAYTYKPVYLPLLRDYNRKTDHRVPTFMVESSYEFENVAGIKFGDPHQLRLQEYTSNLCGSTGQLYGNKYTWPFLSGWKQQLDTPGAIQMKYVQALFEPRRWYDLVPDQEHKVLTAGFGKFGGFDYMATARTPEGRLVMAYLPDSRTVTIDMTQLPGPAIARWYDPASGKFRQIDGSPLPNQGKHQFASPGDNADGPGNQDWVLVLETEPPE
jgi:Protein of unknown function (DUF4038)/Putative collagen-binding domain of a collagenase